MVIRNDSLLKKIDWVTIIIFVILVIAGWFSVCGASFDFDKANFFDFSTRAGKQFVWIICACAIGFILLLLDDSFYDGLASAFYIGFLLLLFLTIFIAPDVKGSRSWLILGPVSLQPAEFAKFATALMLAKYMDSYSFNMKNNRCRFLLAAIIFVPMLLIIMQHETGSALVYLSFFLVLYREGMPGAVLFSGFCAVLYFIVGIRFGATPMSDGVTSTGQFVVLLLIIIFASGMVNIYTQQHEKARNILVIPLGIIGIAYLVSLYVYAFDVVYVLLIACFAVFVYLIFLWIYDRKISYLWIAVFSVASIGYLYSCNYVFNDLLEPHQQVRIKVVLGMEEDLTGAGYNVNQSKIAIGSGGLTGKGFLKGTQTKLKYVPEQDTDFIFCTVGEEQGFIGSSVIVLLFLILILRLIFLSERQSTTFGRVYGYSVVSILIFHIFINIGMVLGITPVIGIPLPFFSYGGSSLWGFTILLFIFLRIDAGR
jgi:rod shape determining protein RodA